MQNFEKALIRELGGWPLTIAIILAQTRRAMNNRELMSWTGLTDKTLSRHLDTLDTKGRVTRTVAGWMLTKGFQLEMFNTLRVLAGEDPNRTNLSENTENFRLESEILRLESENLRLSAAAADRRIDSPTITATTTTTATESENLRIKRQNLSTFEELGIFGKKPRKVATLPWVTPDYIRAWVEYAHSQPWIEKPVGFALDQMEERAIVPQPKAPQAETNQAGLWDEYLHADREEQEPPAAPEFQFHTWDKPVPCAKCKKDTTQTRSVKDVGLLCPPCFKIFHKAYMGAAWRGSDEG